METDVSPDPAQLHLLDAISRVAGTYLLPRDFQQLALLPYVALASGE